MMFEDDRTAVPRAYVALPHDHLYEDHDKDLTSAITWCLSHADGDPRGVGIQAGRRDDLEDAPMLAALAKAGAKIYTDSRGKLDSLPSGPVFLYRPQPAHLWQVERKRMPSAVLAFGITGPAHHDRHYGTEGMVGAQPWITAFKPEHLGGPVIEAKEPAIADPVVAAAMDHFTNSINSSTGLSHSSDHSTVTEGLTKLKAAGHQFDPNDLLAGALARNWRGEAARELLNLATEINAGKKKRFTTRLNPDILEIWRKKAAKVAG
ncbi:hypothetical protein [Paenarthrobacter nitroguajacolicus]|uniref:hypothetical protein n=1 Tax=Paenarthrobacter nitroguajacolicus TaxID=211146 RepID=UPI0015BE8003|nr:hypothetical protein [Paenarthrobacter nitroguajacolicus]NWL32029.1 hypothetical protein [Paenarthrobacter nitroguajacolicus]